MSAEPWTPGPWEYRDEEWSLVGPTGQVVIAPDGDMSNADRRLIAAAPEMAALLDELTTVAKAAAPPDWWDRTNRLLSRIRGEA